MNSLVLNWIDAHQSSRNRLPQIFDLLVGWLILTGLLVFSGRYLAAFSPFLDVFLSWVWFTIPGIILSLMLVPRLSWMERIPLGFALWFGVNVPLIMVGIMAHLTLVNLLLITIGMLLLLVAAYAVYTRRFQREAGENPANGPEFVAGKFDFSEILFLLVLAAITCTLAYLSQQWPASGDDLAGLPYFDETLRFGRIVNLEPFHGTGTPPTPRVELIVYGYVCTLVNWVAGSPADQFLINTRPGFVILTLLAVYSLACQFIKNRKQALFISSLWAIFLLASLMVWGLPGATRFEGTGNDLVTHVFQDKYVSWFIIVPIILVFMLWFLESMQFRYLAGFFLGVFGAALAHPVTLVQGLILASSFGLVFLILEHSKRALRGLFLVFLVLLLATVIPVIQYIRFNQPMPIQQAGLQDVLEYGKIFMTVNRYRIQLLEGGAFILHPSKILQPIILIGYALLPLLILQLRKNQLARLVLGSMVVLPLLLYTPFMAFLAGLLVTPYLIWRLSWPFTMLAVFTIGMVTWFIIDWLTLLVAKGNRKLFKSIESMALHAGLASEESKNWSLINSLARWMEKGDENIMQAFHTTAMFACLGAALAIARPYIEAGFANYAEHKALVETSICSSSIQATKYLDQLTYSEPKTVLTVNRLNFCVAAYAANANVVEYRGLGTVNRLPEDQITESLQRIADVSYFGSATLVDDRIIEMLNHWKVDYVLMENDRLELDFQFRYMPHLFSPVFSDKNFTIYSVLRPADETVIVKGNGALHRREWKQAEAYFDQALLEEPGYVVALLGRGKAQEGLGDIELALESYREASESGKPEPVIHARMASTYLTLGEVKPAIREYQLAISQDPNRSPLLASLGRAYLLAGQMTEAEASFQRMAALLSKPGTAYYYSLVGNALLSANKPSLAVENYRKAIDIDPEASRYLYLARALYQSGSLEEAYQVYEYVSEIDPWLHFPSFEIGLLHESQGEYETAIEAYEKAIRLNPTSSTSFTFLGGLIRRQSGLAAAVERLESLAKLNRVLPGPHLGLAALYYDSGETDKALQELIFSSSIRPNDPYILAIKGFLTMANGNLEEAENSFVEALALNPDLVSAHLGLSIYHSRRAEYGLEAGQLFEIVQTHTNAAWPHLLLTNSYQRRGYWDQAKAEIDWAIQLDPEEVSVYLTLGDYYYSRNQWDEAIRAYLNALDLEPDNSETLYKLGRVHQALGDLTEAQVWFNRAANTDPTDSYTQKKLAEVYWQQGRYEEAIYVLEAAVKQLPSTEMHASLAEAYRNTGRITEAIEQYQMATAISPGQVHAYIAWAQLEMEQYFDINAAENLYYAAVEANPASSIAQNAIGRFFVSQGHLKEAEQAFFNSLSLSASNPNTYLSLSNLYQMKGDWPAALEPLQTAIELFPGAGAAYINLAEFYFKRGEFEKAHLNFVQAKAADPFLVPAYNGLARLLVMQGDAGGAQDILEQALRATSNSPEANLALANFFEAQGDFRKAEDHLLKAVEIGAKDAETYINLGRFYQRQSRFEEASDMFQAASRLPAPTQDTFLNLGRLCEAMNQPDQAIHYYEEAIPFDLSDPRPLLALANLYQAQGAWDETILSLNRALETRPNSLEIHLALGNLSELFGQIEAARGHFEDAASSDLSQAAPFLELGKLYKRAGDWAKAIQALEKAIEIAPTDFSGYVVLAQTYQAMGQIEEAESAYGRGIRNGMDKTEAYAARADFYTSLGEWEQTEADLEKAWELKPASQSLGMQLANFLGQRGDFEQALAVLDELEQLQNVTAQTHVLSGNIHLQKGDWEAADLAFQEALQQSPESVEAYTGLAFLDELQGNVEDALRHYQDAVRNAPYSPQAFENLGNAYQARLDYPNAHLAYAEAVRLSPGRLSALIKLDSLERSMEEPGVDLASLLSRAEMTPSAETYRMIASLYQQRGEWQAAESWYLKAVDFDPYQSASWLDLGNYYRATRQWELALGAFQTALKFEPASSKNWLATGSVQRELHHMDEALAAYNQAIAANPTDFDAYQALAGLQVELGQPDEALEVMEAWVEANSGDYRGYVSLGQIYAQMGDATRAMEIYQAGLDQVPGAASLYVNMGNLFGARIQTVTNDLELADGFLRWAQYLVNEVEDQVSSAQAKREKRKAELKLVRISEIYTQAEGAYLVAQRDFASIDPDIEAARGAYLRALEIQPSNEYALIGLGHLSFILSAEQESLDYYQQSVLANPTSVLAMKNLGFAYLITNQPDEAIQVFQRILLYDPNNTDARYGIFLAHRESDHLNLIQAAENAEYSQPVWEYLMDNIRWIEKS
jgi:tetratricopeptide (TPR) repeat protein